MSSYFFPKLIPGFSPGNTYFQLYSPSQVSRQTVYVQFNEIMMNMHACTVGHSALCPQSGRGIALVRTYQSLLKAIGTLNSSNPNLHTHTSRVEAQNLQVTQVAGYCGACHGTLINHPAGGTFPCSACLGILSTTLVGFARIQAQSQTLPRRRKGLAPLPLSPSRCRSTPHRKCSWHLGHQADGFDSELREMLGRLRGDWWQRRVLVVLLQ